MKNWKKNRTKISECSWPRNIGDFGGVETKKLFCPTGSGRIEAWVNLFGQDSSSISISISQYGLSEKLGERFSSDTSQDWEKISLTFYVHKDEAFKIKFGFTCGGYKADIALDDIKIIGCNEPLYEYEDEGGLLYLSICPLEKFK